MITMMPVIMLPSSWLKLLEQGIECFRIRFPKKMDANDYALKMTPPDKSLGLVIRKAYWMSEGQKTEKKEQKTEKSQPMKTAAKEEKIKPFTPLAAKPPLSPIPQTARGIEADIKEHEIWMNLGERHYRIRGFSEQTGNLKINLMLHYREYFHNDKLDLYSAKQRTIFINQGSEELHLKPEIIKKDLGKLLLKLEQIQQNQHTQSQEKEQPPPLSTVEKEQALSLLQNTNLINIIRQDFIKLGIVGEQSNTLVGYLSCVSRKLDKPLAVMIQSSSAAGKSALMEAILSLIPDNERLHYSAMTGQSLFYLGETSLQHKILAISEEEGASNAAYALKLLQSEGEVTIASTGKDNDSEQLVTKEYTVKGPIMLLMTTTAIDIDEELLNRCLVLSVNESREQTQSIHHIQRSRRTLQGLQSKLEQETITTLHRNAQSLLKPLQVINPYADQLTFLSDKTRTRRDHEKYLTLIDCIALLHQYQREVKSITHNGEKIEYIEVIPEDIELANQLAHEVLGRTLDELPPQTRKLLMLIQQMVSDACLSQQIEPCDYRFSRRQIREYTKLGHTQLKIHCHRLEELEYLLVHRGGRGQSFEYELLYDNHENNPNQHLMGLIEVHTLDYDKKKSGVNASLSGKKSDKPGSSRPQVGGVSGLQNPLLSNDSKGSVDSGPVSVKNIYKSKKNNTASHRSDILPLAAQNNSNQAESVYV